MNLQNTKNLKKQVAPFEKSTAKKKYLANHQYGSAIYYLMVPCL